MKYLIVLGLLLNGCSVTTTLDNNPETHPTAINDLKMAAKRIGYHWQVTDERDGEYCAHVWRHDPFDTITECKADSEGGANEAAYKLVMDIDGIDIDDHHVIAGDPDNAQPKDAGYGFPPDMPFDRVNVSKVLQDKIKSSNEQYFDGKLAPIVLIYHSDTNTPFIGLTTDNEDGTYTIFINSYFDRDPDTAEISLLHEECHVYTDKYHPEFEGHGPNWVNCMHTLADEGAFDSLW